MGWFGFGHAQETKKREADLTLLAPMSGSLVMIEDVPDVIFSEKIRWYFARFFAEMDRG